MKEIQIFRKEIHVGWNEFQIRRNEIQIQNPGTSFSGRGMDGRFCSPPAQNVRSCPAFPLAPALRSAAGRPALFACFAAPTAGPVSHARDHALSLSFRMRARTADASWSSARPRDPFVRDGAFDPGRATRRSAVGLPVPHVRRRVAPLWALFIFTRPCREERRGEKAS